MERMDLVVGPIRIEVIEPLQTLRVTLATAEGLACDLTFEGRAFPIEEPRFTRRNGPRMFMDYTRLTQNVRVSGWTEVDGERRAFKLRLDRHPRPLLGHPAGGRAGHPSDAGRGTDGLLLAMDAAQLRRQVGLLPHQRRHRRQALEHPRGDPAGWRRRRGRLAFGRAADGGR